MSTIIVDEQRRLVKQIVNFTGPIPKGGAKQIGENAVRADLESLISEAPPSLVDDIGSRYGVKDIEAPFIRKDGEEIRLVWENLTVNPGNLPALHNQYRNKNGRPGRRKSVEGQWRARML